MSLHTESIAPGVQLHTLPADKFNRCRLSIHFRFAAARPAATDHALLPLVLERGYSACPDMTALSRKLAKLYGADLTVATFMQGACRVLSVSVTGIKDEFALEGEHLSAEYAALAFGVAFEPYFENGEFSAEAVNIEKATLARQLESEINDKRLYCVRQAQRRFFGNSPAGVARDGYATVLNVDPEHPLSEFGWENLEHIADYCEETGIRLVLFTAPLPSAYLSNTQGYQSYVDAVRQFAQEHGTQYWDFSLYRDPKAMDLGGGDFSDAHHLNGSGAEKFTALLCDVIARDGAGEDVSALFCDTVEEKLAAHADNTIFMADVYSKS